MQEVADKMGIFEGDGTNRVFLFSMDCFERQRYKFAGEILAWSLRNGGPGLPIFNEVLFHFMTEQTYSDEKNIMVPPVLPPGCNKSALEKVCDAVYSLFTNSKIAQDMHLYVA